MYLVTFTSLVAVLLTYFSQYHIYKNFYRIAFFIITFIACIHYNFGTDYESYYDMYVTLSHNFSIENIFTSDNLFVEPGWAFLNLIFSGFGDPLGFILLVAFLNIIQNYIFYVLIKRYVNPKHRWLALIIYLFSSTFYILNFSMMRQGFAVSLIVLAVIFLVENKCIKGFIVVLLASLVHTSALIFIPVLLLKYFKLYNRKLLCILLWISVICMFFFNSLTSSLFNYLVVMEAFEDYQGYADFGSTSIGIGFFLNSIPYVIISYMLLNRKLNLSRPIIVMSVIMFITLILVPFTLNITLIGRLLYYFSVFAIVIIPNLYMRIKKPLIKYGITFIYLFMLLWGYSDFFKPSNWAYLGYKTFHTIFDAF